MSEQTYFLHGIFNDFDEFCENVRSWDVDFHQLDRGKFSSELLMYGNNKTIFVRAKLARRMLQRGSPPPGLRTFGLLVDPNIRIHWRNNEIHGDKLFIFPPGGELYSISQSDFDVFTLSLTEETLEQACNSLELPSFRMLVANNEVFECNPQTMFLLRKWLLQIEHKITSFSQSNESALFLRSLEKEIARRLITALAESKHLTKNQLMRKRDKAVTMAEMFILNSTSSQLTVNELCKIAHVSERTLEYAFRERYGLTPKAFTLVYRLNDVRKELKSSDARSSKVSEIAQKHNFWHMGQFAADYRRHFGELPSETLRQWPRV